MLDHSHERPAVAEIINKSTPWEVMQWLVTAVIDETTRDAATKQTDG